MLDSRLTHLDVRIYNLLTIYRNGPSVSLGGRRIAKSIHADRTSVVASLKRLATCGWIAITPRRKGGARCRYELTDPEFAERAASAAVAATAVVAEPDRPPPVTCPKCGRVCHRIGKAGMCRGCVEEIALEVKVKEARSELGPTATAEDLAAHLKNRRLAARIRKIEQRVA